MTTTNDHPLLLDRERAEWRCLAADCGWTTSSTTVDGARARLFHDDHLSVMEARRLSAATAEQVDARTRPDPPEHELRQDWPHEWRCSACTWTGTPSYDKDQARIMHDRESGLHDPMPDPGLGWVQTNHRGRVTVPRNSLRWALGALLSAYGDDVDADGTHYRDLKNALAGSYT